MSGQITITPRLNDHGDYANTHDITERLLGGLKTISKPERNRWSYGALAAGSMDLRLADPDGRFGIGQSGQSLFGLAGRENALVRVRYPDGRGSSTLADVWTGRTSSKATRSEPTIGETSLHVRASESFVFDAELSPDAVVNGKSMRGVIDAVFNVPLIADNLGAPVLRFSQDELIDRAVIADETNFLADDLSTSATLNKVMELYDLLMTRWQGQVYFFERGALPDIDLQLDGILDLLAMADGTERVVNEFVVKTGLTGIDETLTVRLPASINRWGLRSQELDLTWLRNLELSDMLARRLLGRLAYPRAELKILLDGWALPVEDVVVGAGVQLNVPPAASAAASRWGETTYPNLRLSHRRHPRLKGSYYIQEVMRDLLADTVEITLRETINHGN